VCGNVLVHGGSLNGVELIAAKWAAHRNVPQIAFRPDWTKHGKAAPQRQSNSAF
jgi:YspA, cpYpsA-related SLOG family